MQPSSRARTKSNTALCTDASGPCKFAEPSVHMQEPDFINTSCFQRTTGLNLRSCLLRQDSILFPVGHRIEFMDISGRTKTFKRRAWHQSADVPGGQASSGRGIQSCRPPACHPPTGCRSSSRTNVGRHPERPCVYRGKHKLSPIGENQGSQRSMVRSKI